VWFPAIGGLIDCYAESARQRFITARAEWKRATELALTCARRAHSVETHTKRLYWAAEVIAATEVLREALIVYQDAAETYLGVAERVA
jgi:hypothetical protein